MSVRTIDATAPDAAAKLAKAIPAIAETEDVLLIPRGRNRFDLDEWRHFLAGDCGMTLDKRQFNFDQELEWVDWWEISYQPDKATSYAYSNTRQPLHSDNAWFSDPAEVNFFVMEKQAEEGGEGTFYRLSRLLEDLAKDEPGLLHDLTTMKVVVKKGDEDYLNHTEIIKLDPEPRIYWNYYRTQKQDPAVDRMCEEFFRYLEKKEATPSVDRIRAATGDCFCWHDQRLLHGRLAFKAMKPKDRIVFQSMWRVPEAAVAR
jgi:alpha-ketoglutarate-dependent taurine dioxygenase